MTLLSLFLLLFNNYNCFLLLIYLFSYYSMLFLRLSSYSYSFSYFMSFYFYIFYSLMKNGDWKDLFFLCNFGLFNWFSFIIVWLFYGFSYDEFISIIESDVDISLFNGINDLFLFKFNLLTDFEFIWFNFYSLILILYWN